jgi:hypothetical protein
MSVSVLFRCLYPSLRAGDHAVLRLQCPDVLGCRAVGVYLDLSLRLHGQRDLLWELPARLGPVHTREQHPDLRCYRDMAGRYGVSLRLPGGRVYRRLSALRRPEVLGKQPPGM